MSGQRIAYIRVSSVDQNTARQLDGLEFDETFTDKASGKDVVRPELERMLKYVRKGDHIFVHSLDRLARNLIDLRSMIDSLVAQGVKITFVKESMTFSGESDAMATLMLSVMGAFAEFERNLIRERQREGIAVAKQRGAYRGRPPEIVGGRKAEIIRRALAGEKKARLAKEFGIARETIYKLIASAQAA